MNTTLRPPPVVDPDPPPAETPNRRRWPWAVVAVVGSVTAGLVLRGGAEVTAIDLVPLAREASWRSGQGTVEWGSASPAEWGEANLALQAPMESGVRVGSVIGTHPEWVPHGYLEGDFPLPRPVHDGDRLVGTVGFFVDERCFVEGCRVGGEVDFSVYVIHEGVPREVIAVHDVGNDRRTPRLGADLSPYEGASTVRIRVDAGPTAAQDWAGWWDLRVEPPG
ncbi:hypothetical protein GT755_37555 [Herbidospora sp. NEAU-GS84]|uniref:Glycosyl hydrolase family 98 putative carbohydrate-binding module domain-containing protein n=2 Tax=Herbidospora solisilvae TaxID=2696284 RepID=A0A7C9JKE0_9ACTN|nr:hypothetical protein [Herbidospora solisilvae]